MELTPACRKLQSREYVKSSEDRDSPGPGRAANEYVMLSCFDVSVARDRQQAQR
jgi:hypothetical protein